MIDKIKLVVLAALLILSLQQCSNSNSNDLLQSGSSLLTNARVGVREHLFTITANFKAPSSGFQRFDDSAASSLQVGMAGGLDFSVRGQSGQFSGAVQIALLINEDNSWSSIRVSYLLSGRSDFFLGSYVADVHFASKSSSAINVVYKIPNWSGSQSQFNSVGELSGIRTAASSFSAMLSAMAFNSVTGTLTFTLALQAAGSYIENVFITYIVFPQQSSLIFSTFNPTNPTSATYSFVGLDSIAPTGSILAGAGWTSSASNNLNCVGSGCPSSCVSVQVCTNSGGQVIGNTCFICGTGQTVVNGNCQSVNQCGNNQYWSGSSCLCVSGYVMVSGVCYQLCGANAYILNSQCVCVPGYTYNPSTGQCAQQSTVICSTNFVVRIGVCVCPSPFGIVNGQCLACPAGSSLNANGNCQCSNGNLPNPTTLTCSNPQGCQGGMVFNGVSCVCPTGQFTDSFTGQCTYCNNFGQAVQGTTCVCAPTYSPSASGCVPCPANSVYSATTKQCTCIPPSTLSNGQCVNTPSCPAGFTFVNGQCSTNPSCPPGYTFSNGQCVTNPTCPTGYTFSNGQCVTNPTCPTGFTFVNGQCSTNPSCQPGYTFSNGQCVANPCPFGSQWNAPTSTCKCLTAGQYLINNVCAPCPANTQWNGNSCLALCPAPATWNGIVCVCPGGSNFIISINSCGTCDPNSRYDSPRTTCICNSGYYGTWQKCFPCDSSCATCSGSGSNQCTSCRNGSNPSNGQCMVISCSPGYYVNPNGMCSPCMTGCSVCSSASSCTTCASGYSPALTTVNSRIVTTCSQTPTGNSYQLSLRSYVIGNKVVYQGVSLNLMPTQILASGCSICNNLLTAKVVSSYPGATATVEFVKDSQYWFVVYFDFAGASFTPSFTFTIQLNPTYANYFSSTDMSQKLTGSINPQTPVNTLFLQKSLIPPTSGYYLLNGNLPVEADQSSTQADQSSTQADQSSTQADQSSTDGTPSDNEQLLVTLFS